MPFKKMFVYFWLCWGLFSSCGKRGLLSSCGVQAPPCNSFSLQSMVSGARAAVVVLRGLGSCGSQALEHNLDSCGAQA